MPARRGAWHRYLAAGGFARSHPWFFAGEDVLNGGLTKQDLNCGQVSHPEG